MDFVYLNSMLAKSELCSYLALNHGGHVLSYGHGDDDVLALLLFCHDDHDDGHVLYDGHDDGVQGQLLSCPSYVQGQLLFFHDDGDEPSYDHGDDDDDVLALLLSFPSCCQAMPETSQSEQTQTQSTPEQVLAELQKDNDWIDKENMTDKEDQGWQSEQLVGLVLSSMSFKGSEN